MTVQEAADYLGISPQRVRALIKAQLLPASKHGRDWWIQERVVKTFASYDRPAHRPRKS